MFLIHFKLWGKKNERKVLSNSCNSRNGIDIRGELAGAFRASRRWITRASVTGRRVPRWLQLTIRFREIDDEDAHGDARRRLERGRGASVSLGFSSRFSVSAGYQLAIRALIAFECNVAENFIWAKHEGASRRDGERGGGGDAEDRLGRSGSRCDFVSTLRTPSRVSRSPFRSAAEDIHNICIATARFRTRFAITQHRAHHNDRIFLPRCKSQHYDSAILALITNVIDKAVEMSHSRTIRLCFKCFVA